MLQAQGEVFPLAATAIRCETKIYVVDLAAYYTGKLHDVWIDAVVDDFKGQTHDIIAKSPEQVITTY